MKEIIRFIRAYYREINKPVLILCTLFTALLIWLNYQHRLEWKLVKELPLPMNSISGRYLLFLAAFLVPHILLMATKTRLPVKRDFIICAFAAPFVFALKAGMDTTIQVSGNSYWNDYWNNIVYWPLRLVVVVILVTFLQRFFVSADRGQKQGTLDWLAFKKMNWKPYFLMLLIMLPLIASASTQPDFLATYPKMKEILPLPENVSNGWWYKLLFELSYGSDFFSIEFFFRGFLVIGFMQWVGKDAILPMACFYCTIHFGKPLGECISSYFGGLLLGIVSYHTKSVYGGLMVHLGIAWLMEAGGYIGNMLNQ
jgi:hypothetical protein